MERLLSAMATVIGRVKYNREVVTASDKLEEIP